MKGSIGVSRTISKLGSCGAGGETIGAMHGRRGRGLAAGGLDVRPFKLDSGWAEQGLIDG